MRAGEEPPRKRRRGPRSGEDTRGAIVAAAQVEFAERGYAAATVRSIAGRAGVDPAMINHFFNGKEGLYREATHVPVDVADLLGRVLGGPREEAGRRLCEAMLALWEDPVLQPRLLAILRSVVLDPQRARGFREFLTEELLPQLATCARGPDPRQQAALGASQLLGAIWGRYVLELEPFVSLSHDELIDRVAPVVQGHLDGRFTPV